MRTTPTLSCSAMRRCRTSCAAAATGPTGPADPLGDFWDLPLPAFLALRLGGAADRAGLVRRGMLRRRHGRGARSALVRGLRGLAPFDGTQYPRLPWGRSPVAAADIDRIERWIDEGCPGAVIGSVEIGEVDIADAGRVEVKGLAGPVFAPATDPADWRYRAGDLRQRMDINAMGEPPDRTAAPRLARSTISTNGRATSAATTTWR